MIDAIHSMHSAYCLLTTAYCPDATPVAKRRTEFVPVPTGGISKDPNASPVFARHRSPFAHHRALFRASSLTFRTPSRHVWPIATPRRASANAGRAPPRPKAVLPHFA